MSNRLLRHASLASAIAASVVLTACSSDESRIYDAYKCGSVAFMLDRRAEGVVAMTTVEALLEQKQGNPARYALKLKQDLTDDLELHRLNPLGAMEKIKDVYDSRACQKLYK